MNSSMLGLTCIRFEQGAQQMLNRAAINGVQEWFRTATIETLTDRAQKSRLVDAVEAVGMIFAISWGFNAMVADIITPVEIADAVRAWLTPLIGQVAARSVFAVPTLLAAAAVVLKRGFALRAVRAIDPTRPSAQEQQQARAREIAQEAQNA